MSGQLGVLFKHLLHALDLAFDPLETIHEILIFLFAALLGSAAAVIVCHIHTSQSLFQTHMREYPWGVSHGSYDIPPGGICQWQVI